VLTICLEEGASFWLGYEPTGDAKVDLTIDAAVVDTTPMWQSCEGLPGRTRALLKRALGIHSAEMHIADFLVSCACPGLHWLAKQVAAFVATLLEEDLHKAGCVHFDEAMAIIRKHCRTDDWLGNATAQDLTGGAVRNASQVAATMASFGNMQVGMYKQAVQKKLVKYWLAGREFFHEPGTLAVCADQSRVGQRSMFMGFVVGTRAGHTKAMWLIPQALSETMRCAACFMPPPHSMATYCFVKPSLMKLRFSVLRCWGVGPGRWVACRPYPEGSR
jgi:hypothetical protein